MKRIALLLAMLTFSVTERLDQRFSSDSLSVIYFDVGQGDAAVVRFPGGRVWMVDAGGGFHEWDMGQRELFLGLARLGILTIDVALLSHPDEDHAMGYRGLFDYLHVKEWWVHEGQNRRPVVRELELLAIEKKISQKTFREEETGEWNGAKWRILPLHPRVRNSNDEALVAEISFARCDFLFTGDVEKEGERDLRSRIRHSHEFLKVAHHGSRTSSQLPLLKRIAPKLAIISSGRKNSYGHPHREVVERLIAMGVRTLRTDFHGFTRIDVKADGTYRCVSAKGDCGAGRCE